MNVFAEIGYSLLSIYEGLKVTGRNLIRPKTTLMYPEEREELAPRYRGFPVVNLYACIGCLSCEKVCPNQVIHIERSPGEQKGRWKIDRFDIDYSLCMMCNLCADTCPTNASPEEHGITLMGGYELAAGDRSDLAAGQKDDSKVVAPEAYFIERRALGLPTEPTPPPPPPEKPKKAVAPKPAEGTESPAAEKPTEAKAQPATGGAFAAAVAEGAKDVSPVTDSEKAAASLALETFVAEKTIFAVEATATEPADKTPLAPTATKTED
jgi:NADH-quinone oxidoreductase subunit I